MWSNNILPSTLFLFGIQQCRFDVVNSFDVSAGMHSADHATVVGTAPSPSLSVSVRRNGKLNAALVGNTDYVSNNLDFDEYFVENYSEDILVHLENNAVIEPPSVTTPSTTSSSSSTVLAPPLEEVNDGPPVGAMYESQLRFPVLGTQSFSLHIQSPTKAHLTAAGRLTIDEPVEYSFANGKIKFEMSEKLKSTLKRFLTQLQEVGYDSRTDTPYVKVLPPLPTAVKIFLKRVNRNI